MNKVTENDKYTLIPIVIMIMAVTYLVVGLSEVNIGIFAGDIGLLVTAVLFAQEIKKAVKTKASKELLRHESPINWLKRSTGFFVFSVLSSLAYGFVDVQNVGVEYTSIIEYVLVFSVVFFLIGLLYTVRIIWFIIDPASTANIRAGKIMKSAIAIGLRSVLVFYLLFFQFVDGLMLYSFLGLVLVNHAVPTPFIIVYLATLVLSFVGIIPQVYEIIFRLNEKSRIRDWVFGFFVFSPWIVLIGYSLLLKAGIVPI